ncbi:MULTISPECIES: hypothetical protein [Xanthomonas]|uniref:hypothetical protein n=1 Tax=Xanthomonas TaxID=338 RepID=UPI001ADCDA0B|nr:hypothetical protein [Xanthomonas phaseoli]MBO9769374.1 hypothetical protein [Xanthomonas phaseoli pv. dieffenbachiae]MBO9775607.1 hypothetical protein [Xanthomonas phaseoli pv. dieffenbachiae]MBO9780032.1 hypothetical protein [Xanthomonas phaseoli pv. dieffenbachiae]MBO9794896.1 hypothetical protein [Xanthomonas phaseoli pv. dieffenbachiae]MBO9801038.1 hypothetical protein [Xanthomonas phaseoli pv. dieffenbachiae]
MREKDKRCADARDGGSAARPSCSVVLLDADLCIIFDAYRCAVDASAGNAIRSSVDASHCSESYLPLRRDCRCRMMFGRCLAMFRKLVDHSMHQWCALLRCDCFRARMFKSTRAQEHKSAKEQKSKSAEMLKCKKVSDTKFLKTNWRQSEGGADAHNAAASAARTVIDARMHLAKISVEAIRHVVRSHPVSALML